MPDDNLDVSRLCEDCFDTLASGPRHYVIDGGEVKVVCAGCAGWYRPPDPHRHPPDGWQAWQWQE